MAYVKQWERLADALKRVVVTGLKEGEAKRDICGAIADRKIEIRFFVEKDDGGLSFERIASTVRHGREVDIPAHLKPQDFDWRKSRPVQPWRPVGNDVLAGEWHIKWMELRRADVTNVLCVANSGSGRDSDLSTDASRQAPRAEVNQEPGRTGIFLDFDTSADVSMALPSLALLTPLEVADRVAASCGVSVEDACLRLERAFHDRELRLINAQGNALRVRSDAVVDWAWGALTWPPPLGERKTVHTSITNIRVNAAQLEEWLAQNRSSANKRAAAEQTFAEPFWPPHVTIAWIAFRKLALIESSVRAAKLYDKAQLKDQKPEQTLLRAMQYDNLRAIKEGNELPREYWAGADGRNWPSVHFRREDVLALWPDPSHGGTDHLTFNEISRRWSNLTGEPIDTMMASLISAFWRGAFDRGNTSLVFMLQIPISPISPSAESIEDRGGQYAYSSAFEGAVVRIDNSGEHYLTPERRAARISRRDVATVLGGMSEYMPWAWDGADDGLLAYANIPYSNWPSGMKHAHFDEWRLSRASFAEWYGKAAIWPAPALESIWPISAETADNGQLTRLNETRPFVNRRSARQNESTDGRPRPRSGPKSVREQMRQALAKLYAEGCAFRTQKEAYVAVLKACGLSVATPRRGWSVKTFRRAFFEPNAK